MKGTNEMWGFKIFIFVFSSNFNAVFFLLQNYNLYELLMDHKKMCHFISKRVQRSSKFWNFTNMEGTSNYRIVLSKFYAISFFELIVMRASGNMITDFLHILWFPRQIVPKEQTSTKFQNLNFLIFHLILRVFFP